jgi:hypothetical protein
MLTTQLNSFLSLLRKRSMNLSYLKQLATKLLKLSTNFCVIIKPSLSLRRIVSQKAFKISIFKSKLIFVDLQMSFNSSISGIQDYEILEIKIFKDLL